MIGKRAKILAQAHVEDLLFFARHTRHPIRNQVIVLLSVKAGLRAAEIANLAGTWWSIQPVRSRPPWSCGIAWPRTAAAELFQFTLICAKPFDAIAAPIILEPAARSLRLSAVV